jgi:hypothetical protein
MQQRFTLDKESFEEFLAAASFFQQMQKQALQGGAGTLHGAQPLLVLMETQRAIESGTLDLDSAMERIVALTPRTVGASGAGVWLFTRNEFVCGASRGISPTDERLRLQVLSRLIREFHLQSQPEIAKLDKIDSGDYPGSVKSLLVTPIYQNSRIAGALAAFSSQLASFTERDAANLRLLAGLLTRALATAAEAGLRTSEALEHAALLQLLEQVTPALRELVASAEKAPETRTNFAPAKETYVDSPGHANQREETGSTFPAAGTDKDESRHVAVVSQHHRNEPGNTSAVFAGVRAPVGHDLYQNHPFRSTLRDKWNRNLVRARRSIADVSYLFRRTQSQIAGSARRVLRSTVRATRYRPHIPSLPSAVVERGMRKLRSSAVQAAERLSGHLGRLIEQLPTPTLPHRTLHVGWIRIRLRLRAAGDRAEMSMRKFARLMTGLATRLDLSEAPEPDAKEFLQKVERRVGGTVERSSAWLQSAGQRRVRLRLAVPSLTLNRKTVRKAAPAWAVLAIMLSFLALELGLLRSWTIAARADANSVDLAESAASLEGVAHPSPESRQVRSAAEGQSSKPSGLEGSHLKITDPATEAYLNDMTSFETAALRRRAEYGDDVAAFRLGMAYETGRGVPQSCTKAAEWVIRAAEGGNAAAEFNLGLRYRDGDGVDPDPEQANKWLRRAFAHKYSGAEGALMAMNSH